MGSKGELEPRSSDSQTCAITGLLNYLLLSFPVSPPADTEELEEQGHHMGKRLWLLLLKSAG